VFKFAIFEKSNAMRWKLKSEINPQITSNLSKELGIDLTLSKFLVQRGIESFEQAKSFFRPNLADLHDPFLMKDMELAVERIEQAISNQENILVYGDYDVDGTTSVSLMSSYLKTIHPNIATYIPDRYAEGYGVSFKGIDFAEDNNITLIIALDCGIKAIDKVEYANKKALILLFVTTTDQAMKFQMRQQFWIPSVKIVPIHIKNYVVVVLGLS